jgi:hypothetical protein
VPCAENSLALGGLWTEIVAKAYRPNNVQAVYRTAPQMFYIYLVELTNLRDSRNIIAQVEYSAVFAIVLHALYKPLDARHHTGSHLFDCRYTV